MTPGDQGREGGDVCKNLSIYIYLHRSWGVKVERCKYGSIYLSIYLHLSISNIPRGKGERVEMYLSIYVFIKVYIYLYQPLGSENRYIVQVTFSLILLFTNAFLIKKNMVTLLI